MRRGNTRAQPGDGPGGGVPFPPMEAEHVRELPTDGAWQYEPKWDGFRGVLENASGELRLWSRNGRPLLRYFPELATLGDAMPPRSALDGEIVITRDGVLEFDLMQTRLHPAESRVRRLAGEIPATFIAFDVLLWDGAEIWREPLEARRHALVEQAGGFTVSEVSDDPETARGWLDSLDRAGLDGVVAKRLGLPYLPGSREGVVKVKQRKTADCVGSTAVAPRHHDDIAARVTPLLEDAPDRRFSEPNRWGGGELQEAAVRPELVVEVEFDKVQGNRFRHGAKLLRFRADKEPEQCSWRELRPPRGPDDPSVESLLAR